MQNNFLLALLFSWDVCSIGSQSPCSVKAQASQYGDSTWRESKAPVYSQWTGHMSEQDRHMSKQAGRRFQPPGYELLRWQSEDSLFWPPPPRHRLQIHAPIKCYCFKSLSFGLGYVALVNWYRYLCLDVVFIHKQNLKLW